MSGLRAGSRSHLYRATNPARPLAAIVLAALWVGLAIGLYTMAGSGLVNGVPLEGPAAALVDRVTRTLAVGGALVGGAIIVREVMLGRTVLRTVRLVGAVLLLGAGLAGLGDTLRFALRPGTPIASAATDEGALDAASVTVGRQRLLWTAAGLLGAALVIGGGVASLDPRRARQ
ncbi:MAG TPA: hypothetical protein VFX39_08255 [Gemmatimonadaceae bacterium]|nr:hypothetical protein [Gemmatimonadaceae bacterium]